MGVNHDVLLFATSYYVMSLRLVATAIILQDDDMLGSVPRFHTIHII